MTLRRRFLLVVVGLVAVYPCVLGGLITFLGARFATARAQTRLLRSLDGTAALIHEAMNSQLELRMLHVREWERSARAGMPLPDWLALPGILDQRLRDDLLLTSRLLYRSASADCTHVVRPLNPSRIGGGRVSVVPNERLSGALNALLQGDHPRGSPSERPVTDLRATGPICLLACRVGGTAAKPGGMLVEEIALVPSLRRIMARGATAELASWSVLARTPDNGGWAVLSDSDPERIGLLLRSNGWGEEAPRHLAPEAASGGETGEGPPDAMRWSFEHDRQAVRAVGLLPSTGWLLSASVSMLPELRAVRKLNSVTVLVAVVLSLILTLWVLIITRGIGKAVNEIARKSAAMSRGDLSQPIALGRRDELQTIAACINEMARDLALTAEAQAIARIRSRIIHDLKNVASQMNMLLYNLQRHDDDTEFRLESLSLLRHLATRVNDLALQLRRPESEEPPAFIQVEVPNLIAELLRERIRTRWPDLEVIQRWSGSERAMTDPGLLREAVGNILDNAAEAMAGRGRLAVRGGVLEGHSSGVGHGTTHFLEISDNGPGMTEAFVAQDLFRPFTSTKPGGLGLGMYHASRLLGRLRGRIEVASRPGEGTRVRLEFGRRATNGG